MFRARFLASVFALGLTSCTGSVTFFSTVDYSVHLDAYTDTFAQQGLAGTSAIPCQQPNGDQFCQSKIVGSQAGSDIVLRCNAQNQCDPDPYPMTLDLGVQDLDALADAQISVVDRIQINDVQLTLVTNTANQAVPPFELRWGSESSSSTNLLATTQSLALVDPIAVGTTGDVPITLNPVGLDALDAYVRDTSGRIRFFLVTAFDVEPTVALPAGDVNLQVRLTVRASGQLR